MAITQPAVTEQRNGPSTKQNHVTSVTRAEASADGIIRLTESHGALKSVDVADVDLVLGFADGSFIIIPNGALDALEPNAPKVEFGGDKYNTSLTELFQQVGTVDAADAGNLRIISENIDTRLTELQPDEIDYTSLFMAMNNHTSAPSAPAAPLPQAQTLPAAAQVQRGSLNGRGNNSGEAMDAIIPPRVDQPSTYRLGNRVETGETLQNIGSPVVSGQLYVASQFKTGADYRTNDLPSGARDANDPTTASPAAQATREIINATGNVNLNQQFSQNDTGLWEKNFFIGTNFQSVVKIEITLNPSFGDLPPEFRLTNPNVNITRVGNSWTIEGPNLQNIITQNGGLDLNLIYKLTPDGTTVTGTDPFVLQVVVTGMIGAVPVELPKDFYFSYRDVELNADGTYNTANFDQIFNGNQLLILPARGMGYDIHVDNNGREVIAGSGADIIRGGTGNDSLYGGMGNDTIYAGAGNNLIDGGTGNDLLYSGSGQDTFIGGDGTDTVSYKEAQSNPAANANTSQNPNTPNLGFNPNLDTSQFTPTGVVVNMLDNQFGNLTNSLGINQTGYASGDQFQSIENLEGSDFDDLLIGNAGANSIFGGAGNDTIEGINGGNTLNGGTGSNTVSYAHSTVASPSERVVVNISNTTDSMIVGSQTVIVAANSGKIGSLDRDQVENFSHIIGSQTADNYLIGNDAANYILGGNGDDTITGGGGADTIDGSGGNNTARYTTAVKVSLTNEVYSSILTNSLDGVSNYYQENATGHAQGDHLINIQNLMVTSGNSLLIGNDGANKLTGGSGNDTLIGGKGNDILDGGGGVNTVSYEYVKTDNVGVKVTLENGNNNGIAEISSGNYKGTDVLTRIQNVVGTQYNDTIKGNNTNNDLYGGNGNDSIDASQINNNPNQTNNDRIYGGIGNDTIIASVDERLGGGSTYSNRFTLVDGGKEAGSEDTLILKGLTTDPFNLSTFRTGGNTAAGRAEVTNIDILNVRDNTSTTFSIDALSIEKITGGTKELTIKADNNDSIVIVGNLINTSSNTANGETTTTYTLSYTDAANQAQTAIVHWVVA